MSTAETNAEVVRSAAGVGRNAAILAGATLFCKFGSLAVMPFILRAFAPGEYGAYSAAFAYAGLLGYVAYFGMNPVVTRDIARGERSKGDVVFHCTALRMVFLAISAGALAGIGVIEHFSHEMWVLTWVAFGAMAFDAVTGAVKAAMQAEGRFGRMAAVDIVRKASQWGLAIFVVLTGAGISMLAGSVTLAAGAAMAGAVMMGMSKGDLVDITPAPRYALQMLKLAAPMGLSAAFLLALERVNVWMLDIFGSKAGVGVYQAALSFKPLFVVQSVVWAIMPLAFRLGRENAAQLAAAIRVTARFLLVAGVGLGAVFAAGGAVLVPLLAGANYAESIPVFRIMGLSLPFVFLSFLYLHALTAVDRQAVAAAIFAGGLVTNVLIDLALVPSMGATGAILGTLVTEALIAVSSFACVWVFVGRPFDRSDGRALISTLAAAAVVSIMCLAGVKDLGITGLAVYGAMLVVLKVMTKADVRLLASAFAGR